MGFQHLPDKSWKLDKLEEFINISEKIEKESNGLKILPEESEQSGIFYALSLVPLDKVKVLIIGQDPYPGCDIVNGEKKYRAQGLAFSFNSKAPADDSIKNMFSRIEELGIKNTNTDLTSWAKQGVLLLNTSLTFTSKDSNIVINWRKFWKPIINHIIEKLIEEKKNSGEKLVVMLWGRPANELKPVSYKKEINADNILILRSSHPSNNYGACNTPIFKGTEFEAPAFMDKNFNPFKKCNEFLDKDLINWQT